MNQNPEGVRELVLEQLQGMADGGATVVSTRIWLVSAAGDADGEAYKWHFPPSATELENLRQYATDVAQVQ